MVSSMPNPAAVRATLALLLLFGVPAGCGSAPEHTEGALHEAQPSAPDHEVTSALAALDPASRQALARAPFPVLVFPSRYASRVLSAEGEPWAAVSAEGEGLHLSLHGTSFARPVLRDEEVAALPTPTTFVRGGPAWITINEQIRSAAWHEGAIAWDLEIECDRPMDDTRCTDDTFVRQLAESLVAIDPRGLSGDNGGAR